MINRLFRGSRVADRSAYVHEKCGVARLATERRKRGSDYMDSAQHAAQRIGRSAARHSATEPLGGEMNTSGAYRFDCSASLR